MISQISHVHQPNFLNKIWKIRVETQEKNLKSKKRWGATEFSARSKFGEDENGEEKSGGEGEKKNAKSFCLTFPFLEVL